MRVRKHPAVDVLLDYLDGRASEEAVVQVQAHLEGGCARCRDELASWGRLLGAVERARGVAPLEAVVQRAVALFDDFVPAPSWWERIVAALIFDSRTQPAVVGARSASGPAFQLLFRAGEMDIDLLCEREGS